ncbi:retrovirus-related Pol polyprotein from transposon opus, partial [Trichonephila clavipes]
SHIPPDIASLVRDILIKPDATDPYGNLKTELIKPLGTIEKYDAMRRNFNVPEKLMLELFLQRLPSRVQSILAAVSILLLAKVAEISDRIFEVTPTPVETYAISGASATTTEDRVVSRN